MDILTLLEEKGIQYEKTNNPAEIKIRCISGEHDDANPSLLYNLSTNLFHCWSCGFSGKLKKFLKALGIDTELKVTNRAEIKANQLKQRIQSLRSELISLELPHDLEVFPGNYKGVPNELLKEFGAFTSKFYNLQDYLCFPVYQYDYLRFIIGRALVDNKPKYSVYPSAKTVKDVLFPLDKIERNNSVILVEGIFDMLNLWKLGCRNSLVIFGTQTFHKEKLNILKTIDAVNVYIMLDNDQPGKKASEYIHTLLTQNGFNSTIIQFENAEDPGTLTQEQWNYIKKGYNI